MIEAQAGPSGVLGMKDEWTSAAFRVKNKQGKLAAKKEFMTACR